MAVGKKNLFSLMAWPSPFPLLNGTAIKKSVASLVPCYFYYYHFFLNARHIDGMNL